MGVDPPVGLFGVVILLLAATLIVVIAGVAWFCVQPNIGRTVEDLDNFSGRATAMEQQIGALTGEMRDLYKEIERFQDARQHLLAVLLRIAELLEQFPERRKIATESTVAATRSPDPPVAAATAGSSGRGPWRP